RNKAKRQQAEDAVDTPLQLIGDERQPIAKLHHVIDRTGHKDDRRNQTQEIWIGRNEVQRQSQRLKPRHGDDYRTKAKVLLDERAKYRANDTTNRPNSEENADHCRGSVLALRNDDYNQERTGVEVQATCQKRHKANKRLTPEPDQSFLD